MILVDTGYFLALVNPRDSLYERALAWSETVTGPLLVSEYVLWECLNYLSSARRFSVRTLLAHVKQVQAYEVVPASQALFQKGLDIFLQSDDKQWSITDCISFALMKERNISQALAHDHHFIQAGFDALLRRDP